jgi:hypothetical protein
VVACPPFETPPARPMEYVSFGFGWRFHNTTYRGRWSQLNNQVLRKTVEGGLRLSVRPAARMLLGLDATVDTGHAGGGVCRHAQQRSRGPSPSHQHPDGRVGESGNSAETQGRRPARFAGTYEPASATVATCAAGCHADVFATHSARTPTATAAQPVARGAMIRQARSLLTTIPLRVEFDALRAAVHKPEALARKAFSSLAGASGLCRSQPRAV